METKLLEYIVNNYFDNYNKTDTINYLIKHDKIYKLNLIINNEDIKFNNIMMENVIINISVETIYSEKLYNFINKDKFIYDDIKYCIIDIEYNDNNTNTKRKFRIKNNYNKKQRINFNDMISASRIKNCIIDNHLVEYIKYYNINDISDKPKNNKGKYVKRFNNKNIGYLAKKGIEFENEIIKKYENYKSFIKICNSNQSYNIEYFEKTKQAMKDGYHIIYQAVLHDYEEKIYGCPDLLVRSDKINDIFNDMDNKINYNDSHKSIYGNYHYVVIDFKNNKLKLKKNSNLLLDSSYNIKMNKGQLYVYTLALNNIQGYEPTKSYIYGNNNIIGEIDYLENDNKYKQKTIESIKWNLDMRKNGSKWKLLPKPSRDELYPNMNVLCVDYDTNIVNFKNSYADKIGELTKIVNCGIANRKIALKNGYNSVYDKKLDALKLGFNSDYKKINVINRIIEINKKENKNMILPLKIKNNKFNWRKINNSSMEFYVDFETLNIEGNDRYVFMIGIGYIVNNEFVFKYFMTNNTTDKEEKRIFMDYIKFINKKMNEYGYKNYHLLHWYGIEEELTKKVLKKYGINNKLNYIDLLKLFDNNEEPIGIKNCFNYKLKTIAGELYRQRKIETLWNDDCTNGFDAMNYALNLYNRGENTKKNMKKIIEYNKVDCRVLYDIINYLRLNH